MGCSQSKPDNNPNWHEGISRLTGQRHEHNRDIFLAEIRQSIPSLAYMPYKSHGPLVELTGQKDGVCYALAVLFLLYFQSDKAHADENKRQRRWNVFAIDIQGRRDKKGDLYLKDSIQKLIKDYHKSQGLGNYVRALECRPADILELPPGVLTEEGQQLVDDHDLYEYEYTTPPVMRHPDPERVTMTWEEWNTEFHRLHEEHKQKPDIPAGANKFTRLVYQDSKHFCNRQNDLYHAFGEYLSTQVEQTNYFVIHIPGHSLSAIQDGEKFYFFDSNVGTFAMTNDQQNVTAFLRSFFQSDQIWPDYRRANWVKAYKEGETNLQSTQPTLIVVRFIPCANDTDFGGRTPGENPDELVNLHKKVTDYDSSCCVYKLATESLVNAVVF